jgi:hypothetical protein
VHALVINAALTNGEGKASTVEVRAKPKRLREILRNAGCYTAEGVCGKEIRRALRGLRE